MLINITKKLIIVTISLIFLLVSIAAVMPAETNAASLNDRAKKAYKVHFSGKHGYYAYTRIKGSKAPVFLYSAKAFWDMAGKGKLTTNECRVYVYKKGKVKKVKDSESLLVSNTTSSEIGIYKKKICFTTHNATRELYIRGVKLKGEAVFFENGTSNYYKYKIKSSKAYGKKRIGKKNGKKFMNIRMKKTKPVYFKEIDW